MALPQYSAEASGRVWVWIHFCICTFRKTIFAAAQHQPGGLLVTCDWVPSVKWEGATFLSPVHSCHGALRLKGIDAGEHGMSSKYVDDQAVLITLSFGWYQVDKHHRKELGTKPVSSWVGQSYVNKYPQSQTSVLLLGCGAHSSLRLVKHLWWLLMAALPENVVVPSG